jgi:hypothetical protein
MKKPSQQVLQDSGRARALDVCELVSVTGCGTPLPAAPTPRIAPDGTPLPALSHEADGTPLPA